jgi:DeoR/GlpR family transcriptional regulator of sugar metabolism
MVFEVGDCMSESNSLKIDARRHKILEILYQDGQVRVSQLSELLGATVVTIRNDLRELEKRGYLERFQGGARQTSQYFHNRFFEHSKQENEPLKKRIAIATADLIKDGETIFINSGTTTYLTAVQLKKHRNLNIVTNSIYCAMELGDVPTFRVKLLGGDINNQYLFLYGHDCLGQLKHYRADKTILSVSGICCNTTGITTYHPEEAAMDRLMMERSKQTIVVADSTKFGHEGFYHVAPLDNINMLVTDRNIDKDAAAELENSGIQVVLC